MTYICDICKVPLKEGDHCLRVQKIKDDQGRPIKDAPIVCFHKECIDKGIKRKSLQ